MPNFEGERLNVVMSHINDPSDFYVLRLKNILITKEVSSIIKSFLERDPSLMKIVDEENIESCRNKSILVVEKSDTLYRVQIKSTNVEKKKCSVYFMDVGKIRNVLLDRIRALDKKVFSVVPGPFLFNCRLNLGVPHQGRWSKESANAFKSLTGANHLTMYVQSRVGTKYTCDLYRQNCNINLEIVLMGFCSFVPPPAVHFTSKVMVQFYKPLSLSVGKIENVYVVNFENIDSFLVTKPSLAMKFIDITKDLNAEYGEKTFEGPFDFVVEQSCVACKCKLVLENYTWRRGLVVQVKRRCVSAVVYLVDVGIEINVDFEDMRPLKPELLLLEVLVARCRMTADSFLRDNEITRLKIDLPLTKGYLTLIERIGNIRAFALVKLTIPK